MKRILLFIGIVLCSFSIQAQTLKPDFAYPKTVVKDATAMLDRAMKTSNSHAAVEALLQLCIAENKIDPKNVQKSIELIDSVKQREKSPQYRAILNTLEMDMYNTAYSQNRWVYNNRDIPETPVSDDITQWSGKQFRNRIYSLADSALVDKQMLRNTPITDFNGIIEIDSASVCVYPRLLDFVLCRAITATSGVRNNTDFLRIGVENSTPGSLPWFSWTMSAMEESNEGVDSFYKLFDENKDNPNASLVLLKILSLNRYNDYDGLIKALIIANDFIARFPDCPFANNLYNAYVMNTRARATINCPKYTYPGKKFAVTVKSWCANEVKIVAKRYVNETFNTRSQKEDKEYELYTVHFADDAPFVKDTTIYLTLPNVGVYDINPYIDRESYLLNHNLKSGYNSSTNCTEISPMLVNNGKDFAVLVLNADNGKPMKDVEVYCTHDKDAKKIGNTDKEGVLRFKPDQLLNKDYLSLGYKYNGIIQPTSKFRLDVYRNGDYDIDPFEPDSEVIAIADASFDSDYIEDNTATIIFNTDRSIYRPGDTANWMGIVYTNDYEREQLAPNIKFEVRLMNPNGQEVDSLTVTSDAWGRVNGSFKIPKEGLTGLYRFDCDNVLVDFSSFFRVADIKLPEFEVIVTATERNVPNVGDVTVRGKVSTYSGMPLADCKIEAEIIESSYWYRGNGERVASIIGTTNSSGEFSIVVADSIFKVNESVKLYSCNINATSLSGETCSASTYINQGKPYFIEVEDIAEYTDATEPVTLNIKVLDPENKKVSIPLIWELVGDDKQNTYTGKVESTIDWKSVVPGSYLLKVYPEDSVLADTVEMSVVIYNLDIPIIPTNELFFCPVNSYELTSVDKFVEIVVGIQTDETYLSYTANDTEKITEIKTRKYSNGYHKIKVNLDQSSQELYINLFAVKGCETKQTTVTVSRKQDDKLNISCESFRDKLVPGADEQWHFKISDATGKGAESALVLDMYNKSLDAFASHSLNFFDKSNPYYNSFNFFYTKNYIYTELSPSNNAPLLKKAYELASPTFNDYNSYFFYSYVPLHIYNVGVQNYRKSSEVIYMAGKSTASPQMAVNDYDEAESFEESLTATPSADIASYNTGMVYGCSAKAGSFNSVNSTAVLRESYVPLALWRPVLTTGSDGCVDVRFTLPDANTTWKLVAMAWTKDLKTGKLMREFVASKPVMVKPNLPRFLREGDDATLVALVMNNSDSTLTVTSTVELFYPTSGEVISTQTFTNVIEAGATATVSVNCQTPADVNAIAYRIRSTAENFSDGEQNLIPVLPAEAQVVETKPFYLDAGAKEYTTTLPNDENARISLSYTDNPMWDVVAALPSLRNSYSKCSSTVSYSLFSASIARGIAKKFPEIANIVAQWRGNPSDSTLISALRKNEQLKDAVLNSTPWVQAAQSDEERMARMYLIFSPEYVDDAIDAAIDRLVRLQNSDGGWSWGEWCAGESSKWITTDILSVLGTLKFYGYLPEDARLNGMIDKACRWLDSEIDTKYTDPEYTLMRTLLSNVPISINGRTVIKKTVDDIVKNWRRYSLGNKAISALVLSRNGRKNEAARIIRSIEEYAVDTKGQGVAFPSDPSLRTAAKILLAVSTVEPGNKFVDGIAQHIIIEKQAQNWGNSSLTMEYVNAMLSYTDKKWQTPSKGATIKVDGLSIKPSKVEAATGKVLMDLSKYAGQNLTIVSENAAPSHGAVFVQASRKISEIEPYATDDISIDKQCFVMRDGKWTLANGELRVGDRVKVQLVIKSKRNLNYVTITDNRPAAFEPTDQLPGWTYSEGIGFYYENRDTATNYFVSYMPQGTYLLTYEASVSYAGSFQTGIATIQSQYAPEIAAHSGSDLVTVE